MPQEYVGSEEVVYLVVFLLWPGKAGEINVAESFFF